MKHLIEYRGTVDIFWINRTGSAGEVMLLERIHGKKHEFCDGIV